MSDKTLYKIITVILEYDKYYDRNNMKTLKITPTDICNLIDLIPNNDLILFQQLAELLMLNVVNGLILNIPHDDMTIDIDIEILQYILNKNTIDKQKLIDIKNKNTKKYERKLLRYYNDALNNCKKTMFHIGEVDFAIEKYKNNDSLENIDKITNINEYLMITLHDELKQSIDKVKRLKSPFDEVMIKLNLQ